METERWSKTPAATNAMSIDKESTGMPEVDLHRRTTKVNVGVALGVVVFLVIAALVVFWFARHHG